MRKLSSQLSIAVVCAILGFMVSYQFKSLYNQDQNLNATGNNKIDITVEIEQYKKEKEQLENKNEELQRKLKEYENSAAGRDDIAKSLLDELENTRILTGTTDVKGEGVIVYLTPNDGIFGSNNVGRITNRHLVYIVNELRYAGAEAISINDIRITSRTAIGNAGNFISFNSGEKISPVKRIVIKAIGNKDNLNAILDFQETFAEFKGVCEVKYEKSDDISISKYNKTDSLKYAKPIKKEE